MRADDDDQDDAQVAQSRYPVMPSLVALQQMRNRLSLAYLGKKLMKWTALATGKELRLIAHEINEKMQKYDENVADAFMLLARARYFYPNLNHIVLENCGKKAPVTIEESHRNTAGVKLMVFHVIATEEDAYEHLGLSNGGTAIFEAKHAWRQLLMNMIDLLQLRDSFHDLWVANKNATKKKNGILRIVIPRLKATITYIIEALEEIAREDFYRLKKVIQTKHKKILEKEGITEECIQSELKRICCKEIESDDVCNADVCEKHICPSEPVEEETISTDKITCPTCRDNASRLAKERQQRESIKVLLEQMTGLMKETAQIESNSNMGKFLQSAQSMIDSLSQLCGKVDDENTCTQEDGQKLPKIPKIILFKFEENLPEKLCSCNSETEKLPSVKSRHSLTVEQRSQNFEKETAIDAKDICDQKCYLQPSKFGSSKHSRTSVKSCRRCTKCGYHEGDPESESRVLVLDTCECKYCRQPEYPKCKHQYCNVENLNECVKHSLLKDGDRCECQYCTREDASCCKAKSESLKFRCKHRNCNLIRDSKLSVVSKKSRESYNAGISSTSTVSGSGYKCKKMDDKKTDDKPYDNGHAKAKDSKELLKYKSKRSNQITKSNVSGKDSLCSCKKNKTEDEQTLSCGHPIPDDSNKLKSECKCKKEAELKSTVQQLHQLPLAASKVSFKQQCQMCGRILSTSDLFSKAAPNIPKSDDASSIASQAELLQTSKSALSGDCTESITSTPAESMKMVVSGKSSNTSITTYLSTEPSSCCETCIRSTITTITSVKTVDGVITKKKEVITCKQLIKNSPPFSALTVNSSDFTLQSSSSKKVSTPSKKVSRTCCKEKNIFRVFVKNSCAPIFKSCSHTGNQTLPKVYIKRMSPSSCSSIYTYSEDIHHNCIGKSALSSLPKNDSNECTTSQNINNNTVNICNSLSESENKLIVHTNSAHIKLILKSNSLSNTTQQLKNIDMPKCSLNYLCSNENNNSCE